MSLSACETVPFAAGAARGSTDEFNEAAVPIPTEEEEDEKDGRRLLHSRPSSSSSSLSWSS